MASRSVPSHLLRMVLSLVVQALVMEPCSAQDLSVLSDFGNSEIVVNGSLVMQNGTSNSAQISQTVDSGGSTGHYAEINQQGADNQGFIEQSGDLNRARFSQDGSGNVANATQTGFSNFMDTSQTGSGNALYATQTGNTNSMVLSQAGAATANLVEIGNNNTIHASQGAGGMLNIRLEGNGMTVTVHQN